MYSLVLRVKACFSSSAKRYLQSIPVCVQKPPIPHSYESKKVVMVVFLQITLFMEMPSFADSRNSSHRSRSSMVRLKISTLVLRLDISSIQRRLLIKCLAFGIMKQKCPSLTIRVGSYW